MSERVVISLAATETKKSDSGRTNAASPRENETVVDAAKPAEPTKRSGRGFASMTPEQRSSLGSRGGKTAHERGTANRFDSDSASAAGRIPHLRGTAYKWTSELAAEAGRKGGSTPRRTRKSRPPPSSEPYGSAGKKDGGSG
jgi:general stress protein YciG